MYYKGIKRYLKIGKYALPSGFYTEGGKELGFKFGNNWILFTFVEIRRKETSKASKY
jgi:hypothetical protein